MLKRSTRIMALLLVVIFTLGSVACGAPSLSKKKKIGILAPAATHGWVAGTAYYSEQYCKELNETVNYRIFVSNNAEEMASQLDDLKQWGADAIVMYPQWEGMEVAVAQAIAEGIPVVAFDLEVKTDGVYLVTGDNRSIGVAGAEYIYSKIGTEGKVVLLEVPSSGAVSQMRKGGFMEKISELAPNIEVVTYSTKMTREDGLRDFADILMKNPKIDAVFSMDDETSIGVLKAIREANRTDIKVITGGGGCQEYFRMMSENKDIWLESSLYSPSMIKDAIDMAIDIVNGKEVEKQKVIPTKVVDKDNCDDYIDDNNTVY